MKDIQPAILMLMVFTVICGGIYPALVTGMAQAVFPIQANGSLVTSSSGRVAGSILIGQPFSDPRYFWPRPSASGDSGYDPMASGGSNAGPTNPDYLKTVAGRVTSLRNNGVTGSIPAEMVQASASGLDPHLSLAAVMLQMSRVAGERGISEKELARLIARTMERRQFGFLGVPRVNLLVLNLELDRLKP